MKKCNFCAEEILEDAKICKHCKKEQKKKGTPLWQWVLLIFVVAVFFSASRSSNKTETNSYTPAPDPISVKVTKFSTDGNYYHVIGRIQNDGSVPYRFVQVGATFYDKNKSVSGTNFTYACGQDYVQPGGQKAFDMMGHDPGDYNTVKVSVNSYK